MDSVSNAGQPRPAINQAEFATVAHKSMQVF
jgi:hypothetical protein